jgi:hypothetical protein
MNPNYVAIMKQEIDKLLVIKFIQLIEEAIWLSSIVIVLKKMTNYKFVSTSQSLMLQQIFLLIPFGVKNGSATY